MENITRYTTIKCIKTKSDEIIPIWSDRLELTGHGSDIEIQLKDDPLNSYYSVFECIFDLEERKILKGIVVDRYIVPDFKVDEVVYFEKKDRILSESKIKEIVYEFFTSYIVKGIDIDDSWMKSFSDIKLEDDTFYNLKEWTPYYILENGLKIKQYYKLFRKE